MQRQRRDKEKVSPMGLFISLNNKIAKKIPRVFILIGLLFLYASVFPGKIFATDSADPTVAFLTRWKEDSGTTFNTLISIGDLWTPTYGAEKTGKTYKIEVCSDLYHFAMGDQCRPVTKRYEKSFTYSGEATQRDIEFFVDLDDVSGLNDAGVILYDDEGNLLTPHWIRVDMSAVTEIPPPSGGVVYVFCQTLTVVTTDVDGPVDANFVLTQSNGDTISNSTGSAGSFSRNFSSPRGFENSFPVTASGYEDTTGNFDVSVNTCTGNVTMTKSGSGRHSSGTVPVYTVGDFTLDAQNAQKYAIGIGIFLSLFILPYIGILWASGNPENIQKATEWFQSWFWGLLLLLLSGTIIRIVGSEFLKIG